jgi:GntR family transcriptional regulator, rspAB operon transcriptional repressor
MEPYICYAAHDSQKVETGFCSVLVHLYLISMLNRTRTPKRLNAVNKNASKTESLADRAYGLIRDAILQGNLAVGDALSRRRLAEEFNMSFLPITEALQRLEAEGLVESRPRVGTRVRIPTKQDIVDSYVIREALESQAARLCCASMTTSERDQLLRSAQHLDRLYKVVTSEQEDSRFLFSVHTYHMQFHVGIAEMARCPGLLQAIQKEQVLIFNWVYELPASRKALPSGFHNDLAKAICSGDPLKADQAMRSHVRYGMEQLIEGLASLEVAKGWRMKRAN